MRILSDTNYSSSNTPSDYKCDHCGKSGVKLWREYQTFADHTKLLCTKCAMFDQKKTDIDHDSIGWLIPAVPVEGENSFWGYTSVPQAGVDWWKALPE